MPIVANRRTPWRSTMQLRVQGKAQTTTYRHTPGLAYAAQQVVPMSLPALWQQQEARHRLIVACSWLEERLSKPIRIRRLDGNARRVEVFESLTYTILPQEKRIVCGELRDGHNVFTDYAFEIGRPLITPYWLRSVLEHIGLYQRDQRDLFLDEELADEVNNWVARITYRLLLREPDFQKLRRVSLPQAFKLPLDVYSIALASRTHPVGPLLDSRMRAR